MPLFWHAAVNILACTVFPLLTLFYRVDFTLKELCTQFFVFVVCLFVCVHTVKAKGFVLASSRERFLECVDSSLKTT